MPPNIKNNVQIGQTKKNVRLLLQKLGRDKDYKYTNFILLSETGEISCEETMNILSSIFSKRSFLFHTRYKCLDILKGDGKDFVTSAGKLKLWKFSVAWTKYLHVQMFNFHARTYFK